MHLFKHNDDVDDFDDDEDFYHVDNNIGDVDSG